jgi:hypothetical protein
VLYLTLNPLVTHTKDGVSIRGADFSVLLFASVSQARASVTKRVKLQLRERGLPWVEKANLILVARARTSRSDETWKAAEHVLARMR